MRFFRSIKILIVVLFVVCLIYNVAPRDFWSELTENFGFQVDNTNILSSTVYDKNKGAMCDTMNYGASFLTDSNDILSTRFCMGYKDPNINFEKTMDDSMKTSSMFIDKITKETMNLDSLRIDIERKLFDFKKGQKVQGPVYAMISQAPYYTDKQGDVIFHQPFNKNEYLQAPNYEFQSPPKNGLYVIVYLLYPMYDKAKQRITITNFKDHLLEQMKPYHDQKTHGDMCKIHCIGDTGLFCGCLNTNSPYSSRCLGPVDETDTQNTAYTTYTMMYRVNESSKKMKPYFTKQNVNDVSI